MLYELDKLEFVEMVRIAASQAADVEFESHRGHCGYSITVVHQIVVLKILGSIPGGHIWAGRIAAIAADCKSADHGLRWFESNPAHLFVCVSEMPDLIWKKELST